MFLLHELSSGPGGTRSWVRLIVSHEHRQPRAHSTVTVGSMAKDWGPDVSRARAALIVAALRKSLLTYTELGAAIGMFGIDLRNQARHILDQLSEENQAKEEPSLAALVVSGRTGKPGSGWTDGATEWHTEVRRVFDHNWISLP